MTGNLYSSVVLNAGHLQASPGYHKFHSQNGKADLSVGLLVLRQRDV